MARPVWQGRYGKAGMAAAFVDRLSQREIVGGFCYAQDRISEGIDFEWPHRAARRRGCRISPLTSLRRAAAAFCIEELSRSIAVRSLSVPVRAAIACARRVGDDHHDAYGT
jgi:hypothetical protein